MHFPMYSLVFSIFFHGISIVFLHFPIDFQGEFPHLSALGCALAIAWASTSSSCCCATALATPTTWLGEG